MMAEQVEAPPLGTCVKSVELSRFRWAPCGKPATVLVNDKPYCKRHAAVEKRVLTNRATQQRIRDEKQGAYEAARATAAELSKQLGVTVTYTNYVYAVSEADLRKLAALIATPAQAAEGVK